MTPERLRAVANDNPNAIGYDAWADGAAAALRVTADQLEAVQAYVPEVVRILDLHGYHASADRMRAILTADTAPQEDRDE